MLSVPLNVHVLQALAEEPRPLIELRRTAGSPPQTTMRGHLRALTEAGIIERRRQTDFPGTVDFQLTKPGHELFAVAEVLQRWLNDSPDGPIELGTPAAKSAIKALVDGWSTGIVRVLAAKRLSLTELSGLINSVSYPSLERRLGAMRLAGQIERCSGNGRGTPYGVTDWLRRAIAPLAAGARWERRNAPAGTAPIKRLDIEAAFLLVVPLVELEEENSGVARMAVETRNGDGQIRLAGVTIGVEEGRIASCVARLEGEAETWASGSATAWLRAVIDRDAEQLEVRGDCNLARSLTDGLNDALFGSRQPASPIP